MAWAREPLHSAWEGWTHDRGLFASSANHLANMFANIAPSWWVVLHKPSILWLQLPILTNAHKLYFGYTKTLGSALIPCTLVSNSKQDNSEEYKCLLFSALPSPPPFTLTLSLHNNQLRLHASYIHPCCTFLSDLIPSILLLLYHRYPCSFPFIDIILLDSYKYASHVPVFFTQVLVTLPQQHWAHWPYKQAMVDGACWWSDG